LRTKSLFIAVLVLTLAVLAAACQPEEAAPATGVSPEAPGDATPEAPADATPEVAGARATPPELTPTLPLAGKTTAAPPQVIVSDQFVRDGSIVVDQAVVPEDGWVVIHDTLPDGAPGEVVGYARIGAQLNLDVSVQIERSFDGPTQLVAMLHRNIGDPESFDFPEADPPFTENGRPVVDRFTVRPSQ
jgi:hypothetical protein